MLKEERFDLILDELKKEKTVSYQTFAMLTRVSEDTIRRDIEYLYKNGLISKVRGGAMLRSKDPLSFNERETVSTKEKDIIALKAQRFIKNEMTIFLDGGTTVCAIVSHISRDYHLRIVTNNPKLIPIVSDFPNIELILLGGKYYPNHAVTAGADTCLEVNNYTADLYFMGTCGIHPTNGASAIYKEDAEVKRAMCKSAKKIIVLADKNKLRITETFKASDLENIDVLITDLSSDDNQLNDFRDLDIQIV